jgi:hypothetical protein
MGLVLVKRVNVNDLSDVCGRETHILRLWLGQFNEDFLKSIMKSLLSKEPSLRVLSLKRVSGLVCLLLCTFLLVLLE